jgi:hypothetical protein
MGYEGSSSYQTMQDMTNPSIISKPDRWLKPSAFINPFNPINTQDTTAGTQHKPLPPNSQELNTDGTNLILFICIGFIAFLLFINWGSCRLWR